MRGKRKATRTNGVDEGRRASLQVIIKITCYGRGAAISVLLGLRGTLKGRFIIFD